MTLQNIFAAAFGIAVFFMAAGCTEVERSGYSPIPQNSPASWELRPYGDLRN